MGWRTFSMTEETALPKIESEDDAASQGSVHKEFMQEGCTVNAGYYKGVLDHPVSHI
jgi:hypothetical protein